MREAQEFYSENAEKMAEKYDDDKLPEESLQMRKRFSKMVKSLMQGAEPEETLNFSMRKV